MTGTIRRGKIIRADLALWDGQTSTYSRIDATGGTISGLALGDTVDVLQVYGSGTQRTRGSIAAAVQAIGSSKAILAFAPGTWTIDSDTTIPSNLTCQIPAGCILSISSGITLTIAGSVNAGLYQIFSGSGSVVVSGGGRALPKWWGAVGDGSTDDTTAISKTASTVTGDYIDLGGLTYRVSSTLPASPLPAGVKFWNGEFDCPQTVIPSIDRYSVVALGNGALLANTFIPEQNAAGGGIFYASGNHVVAVGTDALRANTTGRRITAVGSRALLTNTTGYYNTAIGSHALEVCSTGFENTALGVQCLQNLTTGQQNVAAGPLAAGLTTTGSFNVAIGRSALRDNTTTSNNTAVGHQAGLTVTSSNNVAIGYQALSATTTGDRNTVVGATAVGSNTTGSQITAVGYRAALVNTANNTTAIGTDSLISNTSGTENTAVGYNSLSSCSTGQNNTACGYSALAATTGSNNTACGTEALISNVSGARNSALGYSALSTSTTYDNTCGLGYNSQVTGSNQLQLGDSNTTSYAYGALQNRSDARDKADVRDTLLGLDFVLKLRAVDYRWDLREDYGWQEKDGSKKRTRFHHGFIAQEVKAAADSLGADFGGFQDHSIKGGKDVQSLGYGEFIAPLIRAIQEQQKIIEALTARVATLEGDPQWNALRR